MDTLEIPITGSQGDARGDGDAWEVVGRREWGPKERPPISSRLFVGLIAAGAMLATGALLLSDRAPGALRTVFGDRARRLWERIERSERIGLPASSDLPATDFLVHIAIWAVVALLVGLSVWSWRFLGASAVVLGSLSIILELAQGRYSTTRAVQFSDAVANLLGIGAGVVAAAACYGIWSGLAVATRRFRVDA